MALSGQRDAPDVAAWRTSISGSAEGSDVDEDEVEVKATDKWQDVAVSRLLSSSTKKRTAFLRDLLKVAAQAGESNGRLMLGESALSLAQTQQSGKLSSRPSFPPCLATSMSSLARPFSPSCGPAWNAHSTIRRPTPSSSSSSGSRSRQSRQRTGASAPFALVNRHSERRDSLAPASRFTLLCWTCATYEVAAKRDKSLAQSSQWSPLVAALATYWSAMSGLRSSTVKAGQANARRAIRSVRS
jgi:hypothetical protein